MKMRRLCAYIMALLLVVSMPLTAFAVEADISLGDVNIGDTQVSHTTSDRGTIQEDHGGSVTVTQSNPSTPTNHSVSVNTSSGSSVNVTLQNVNIDVSGNSDKAAVEVKGSGNVTIELDGTNTVKSGDNHAGVEKNDGDSSGKLTITDDNETTGSLAATGGKGGAGIGGGQGSNGSDITISGGTVNANGGENAAGIGGGAKNDATNGGNGSNITISGGTVTATGGFSGAGIGGASGGTGSNITISDGTVNATGVEGGAGIGGGGTGKGSDITIRGGTVNANGGTDAAGIGGGSNGNGSNITISGGTTTAIGGDARESSDDKVVGGGAGIGGGAYGTSDNITVKYTAQVTAEGKGNAANIGNGYASEATEKQKDKVDLSGLSSFGKVNGVPGSDGGFHASDGSSGSSGGSFVSFFGSNSGSNSSSSPSYKARLNIEATLGKITSTDNDGNDLSNVVWLKEEGSLNVTTPADNVLVTGNKADLLQLTEDGVKKINLQTNRVKVSVSNQVLDKITDSGGGFRLSTDNTTVNLTATDQNNKKTLDMTLTANKQSGTQAAPDQSSIKPEITIDTQSNTGNSVKTLQVSTNAPEATLSYDQKFLNALMNSEFGKLALDVRNVIATVDGMLGAITAVNGSGSISIGETAVEMNGMKLSASDSSGNDKLSDMVNRIHLQMGNQSQGGSTMVVEVNAKAAMASASLKVPESALQSLMDQGIEETTVTVGDSAVSFNNSDVLEKLNTTFGSKRDSASVILENNRVQNDSSLRGIIQDNNYEVDISNSLLQQASQSLLQQAGQANGPQLSLLG